MMVATDKESAFCREVYSVEYRDLEAVNNPLTR
jgi:hypothetical protein